MEKRTTKTTKQLFLIKSSFSLFDFDWPFACIEKLSCFFGNHAVRLPLNDSFSGVCASCLCHFHNFSSSHWEDNGTKSEKKTYGENVKNIGQAKVKYKNSFARRLFVNHKQQLMVRSFFHTVKTRF